MWQFAVAAVAIAAVIGVLANAKQSGKLEERARVSEEASMKNDRSQAARKRVNSANANSMLERWYRD